MKMSRSLKAVNSDWSVTPEEKVIKKQTNTVFTGRDKEEQATFEGSKFSVPETGKPVQQKVSPEKKTPRSVSVSSPLPPIDQKQRGDRRRTPLPSTDQRQRQVSVEKRRC